MGPSQSLFIDDNSQLIDGEKYINGKDFVFVEIVAKSLYRLSLNDMFLWLLVISQRRCFIASRYFECSVVSIFLDAYSFIQLLLLLLMG